MDGGAGTPGVNHGRLDFDYIICKFSQTLRKNEIYDRFTLRKCVNESSGRCQLGRDHLIKLGVETKLGFAQEAGCQKHMSLGCKGYGSKLLDPQNGWLIDYL